MRTIAFGVALLSFVTAASAQSLPTTPKPCPVTVVTTGGTAVIAAPARVNGGVIWNYPDATETLYVDETTTATTSESATNYPLPAGQPWFLVPNSPVGASVNAATSGHHFGCLMW